MQGTFQLPVAAAAAAVAILAPAAFRLRVEVQVDEAVVAFLQAELGGFPLPFAGFLFVLFDERLEQIA
ncbi:hypothetical protein D3C71_1932730 [compost metagenome]